MCESKLFCPWDKLYKEPSSLSLPQFQFLPPSMCRIVIVLLAQTAFGTKVADETVTYLNKGQAYEVKLFTTDGQPKEKLFKSTVRLCFYERRYQFSEQEQIISWQIEHPGERMLVLGECVPACMRAYVHACSECTISYWTIAESSVMCDYPMIG